jgi:hypothetical protein
VSSSAWIGGRPCAGFGKVTWTYTDASEDHEWKLGSHDQLDKIKIVADLMRHDSYRTTERHYIKKVQEMRRRAAVAASAGMPRYADSQPTAPPRREKGPKP